MKTLLIVYYSRTGGTARMAAAAAEAAEGLVRLVPAPEAHATDVLGADGYIFAAPENLAALAGEMKAFFDRTYYPVLDRVAGRPCALMVCAGSDGEGAVRQMARIATGWRLRQVAAPLIIRTGAQTAEAILAPKVIGAVDLARCAELGAALAAGMAAGVF